MHAWYSSCRRAHRYGICDVVATCRLQGMVAGGNRLSRLMVEECFKWANQRMVFGKRLIDQPVIRQKLVRTL